MRCKLSSSAVSSSFQLIHEESEASENEIDRDVEDLGNRLIKSASKIDKVADHSKTPINPRDKRRELKRRDKRLTELAQHQNACWTFITLRKLKPQDDIYMETLVQLGQIEAIPISCS